jgi:hypothetical protein
VKPYLSTSISFVIVALAAFVPHGAVLDPAEAKDFAAKDNNRIKGNISKALARSAPYVDVLPGGTFDMSMSETQRAVVQERAVLNKLLTRPQFKPTTQMCGTNGEAAEVGSTEYSFTIGGDRGMGPLVCVKTARLAFKRAYSVAEDALRKQIIQYRNADIRATLLDRSGTKLTVLANSPFDKMFNGDAQRIDVPFDPNAGAPTGTVNWKLLKYASNFLREDLLVDPFESGDDGAHLKFLGGHEILDILRDEAGIRDDHRYLAAGSYKVGEKLLRKYRWEGNYRGIALGFDPQPLRFSELDDDGQPLLIEPEVSVKTSNGVAARTNPLWLRARFEICFLMGTNSFRLLVPESYTGEGSWKWPAQLAQGELKFKVIEDNDKNAWGDYGRHFYQYERGYQPERPHAVMPIAFKRRPVDFGINTVDDSANNWSSVDSL